MSTNTFNGVFFLRSGPGRVRLSATRLAWRFSLAEREPGGGQLNHAAIWQGSDAELFVAQHSDRLKSGCALRLELERLRVDHDEVTGDIVECQLAPDRWPARSEAARSGIAAAVASTGAVA